MGILDFLRRLKKGGHFRLVVMGADGGWSVVDSYSRRVSPEEVESPTPGLTYALQELDANNRFRRYIWKEKLLPGPAPQRALRERAVPPQEMLAKYARGLASYLEPLNELGHVLETLKGNPEEELDKFLERMERWKNIVSEHGESSYGKLEFSGAAPWVFHPVIVKQIADTIKDVGDHIADRFVGPAQPPGVEIPEEGVIPELPSPEQYMVPVEEEVEPVEIKVEPPKPEVKAPLEEEVEEETAPQPQEETEEVEEEA